MTEIYIISPIFSDASMDVPDFLASHLQTRRLKYPISPGSLVPVEQIWHPRRPISMPVAPTNLVAYLVGHHRHLPSITPGLSICLVGSENLVNMFVRLWLHCLAKLNFAI